MGHRGHLLWELRAIWRASIGQLVVRFACLAVMRSVSNWYHSNLWDNQLPGGKIRNRSHASWRWPLIVHAQVLVVFAALLKTLRLLNFSRCFCNLQQQSKLTQLLQLQWIYLTYPLQRSIDKPLVSMAAVATLNRYEWPKFYFFQSAWNNNIDDTPASKLSLSLSLDQT